MATKPRKFHQTSVNERRVKSVAGRSFDFIENNISPEQTRKPCNAEREEFLTEIKMLLSLNKRTKIATAAQKIPAIATVVNFGVFSPSKLKR